jgi:spore germination protein YaaH
MRSKLLFFSPIGKRGRASSRRFWLCGTIGLLALFGLLQPVSAKHNSQIDSVHREEQFPLMRPDGRALSVGFYVNDDDNSFPDLRRAAPHLDWLIPSWLTLEGPSLRLTSHIDEKVRRYVSSAKPDMSILPMVQNLSGGKWDGDGLAKLLADPKARGALIQNLKTFLDRNKFQGLTVDFEEVPPAAHPDLKLFLDGLREAFADRGYAIVLVVPIDNDDWPYETYADIADYLLLMGYDEHWSTGTPGSIAGQGWFKKALGKRMQTLDPTKTIVALGGYGYDWGEGAPATPLSFRAALLLARNSGANIVFDPKTLNPHFSFEDDGKRHDVWFLDGVTAFNEIHAADSYRPAGFAVWRLGSEDPSVWSVMDRPYGASAPKSLHYIGESRDMDLDHAGGILGTAAQPFRGERTFETDKDGNIVGEIFAEGPRSVESRNQ